MMSLDNLVKLFSVNVSSYARELAERYGYRPYMVERYYEILGDWSSVKDLLEAFEKPLPKSIRCNTLKVSDCSYLVKRLGELNYVLEVIPWVNYAYKVVVEGAPSAGATHEYLVGMYYLHRGLATLIPPLVLSPRRDDVILDLAAAPGGKTTHLAQLMGNEGVIVAVDVSRLRMRALRSNLERLGVWNVVAVRMDGRLVTKVFGPNYFTKVLLDAPCTGEGLIQVDKSRKFKTDVTDLARASQLQYELLRAAVESAVSGGYVLYSTCSIAPEENEFVVDRVLGECDCVEVVDIPRLLNFSSGVTEFHRLKFSEVLRRCVRVYPHLHGMEGFFLCLLRKL